MVLETRDWQLKRGNMFNMPAETAAQTSHPALPAQPGCLPDPEVFGAPCDTYTQVHSSSAVQIPHSGMENYLFHVKNRGK